MAGPRGDSRPVARPRRIRRSLGVSGEDPKKRGRVSSCVMRYEYQRSRAAHPGPDPDETYAMTVYVSDTIDAGSDDQEVRFAPSPPAASTASRRRDGRTKRFASHRRRRPRRPPAYPSRHAPPPPPPPSPPVPFASRTSAAAPAIPPDLDPSSSVSSHPPTPQNPTFVPLEDEDPDAAAWEDPSEDGVLTRVLEACEEGEDADKVASLLGRMSVSVDAVGADGDAPLHLASLYGHAPSFASSWRRARTPSCVTATGTPLHDASAGGFDDVVDALLEAAKTRGCLSEAADARDGDGETPLHTAARGGHVSVVTRLVAAGASRDASSDAGLMPFHFAEEGGTSNARARRTESPRRNDDEGVTT